MAKPIFEAASGNGVNTLGRHLLCQILTEVAVNCPIDLSLPAKCEGYPLHIYCWYNCANQSSVQGEKIQLAIDEHFQGRRIAAGKLIVIRKRCDIDSPAGFGLYGRPHFD